ncbi:MULTISPECIES: hypothetical protein [unclassified Corynebacterium]|uniref:hypothetical protein n=1 Tax=unclassified Corynebacterium TaxID=2624378 RepID=UPI001EF2CE69|nr:hypothetical protein [Corynebacterium sp. ACRPH]MCG7457525.1 hypothetical protein [Corynebacterium sp. ACRPH]
MSSMAYSIGCVPAEFPRTFRLRRSGISGESGGPDISSVPGYGSASPLQPIGLGRR